MGLIDPDRSAEALTYQYGSQYIKHHFAFDRPKNRKLTTGSFSGNRFLADLNRRTGRTHFPLWFSMATIRNWIN
jgi:hypothetical protein